ncbi:cytochrome P450 [Melanogaster broomeanus]|nr:cytochrome P450 [Melanogaster broomeanus]
MYSVLWTSASLAVAVGLYVPVLGNLLDIPRDNPWLTYNFVGLLALIPSREGNIVSIQVFGRWMIILSSSEHAKELLEKRSANYSGRPVLHMAGEMIGWDKSLALLQCGTHFKEYRKNLHHTIAKKSALEELHPVVECQVHRFMQRLIVQPLEINSISCRMSGSLILAISHGNEMQMEAGSYLHTAETAIRFFATTSMIGGSIVDIVPMLRYLPSWFPGTSFWKTATDGKKALDEMADKPHEVAKAGMAAGTALPSLTTKLLEGRVLPTQTLYSGEVSISKTVATTRAFFLAMTLFPEVQRTAQAEIDSVVGQDQLPTLRDRAQLPYFGAVLKELVRWFPVTPLAVPHVVASDDLCEGACNLQHLVGSLDCPESVYRAMLQDLNVYPEPMKFKPERFLPLDGKQPEDDPYNVCFGFGRRKPIRIPFADMSIFIQMAMILSTFNIKKATEAGKVITPEVKPVTGTITYLGLMLSPSSHPYPFKCTIEPRSAKAVELIRLTLEKWC